MYQIDSIKYNDIDLRAGLYSINRRLMFAVGKDNINDNPIYISISDGVTTINNLEMCEVESNTYVIDLAPFIRTMFTQFAILNAQSNASNICKLITITATSEGSTTITKNIYCTPMRGTVKQYYTYGDNITYNNVTMVDSSNWNLSTTTTNVYQSDWIVNDMSNLILPEGLTTRIVQDTLGFDNLNDTYNITVNHKNATVSATTTLVTVQKKLSNNTTALVGTRSIVRQHYCRDKHILILYLTSYGQFEYFVFDGYTSTTTIEKTNPVYSNILRSNYYGNTGVVYGNNISEEITASVLINNELIASKWNDIITSTQVYVYNPNKGAATNPNAFESVQLSGQYNFNPRKGSRQSIILTKNTDYIW